MSLITHVVCEFESEGSKWKPNRKMNFLLDNILSSEESQRNAPFCGGYICVTCFLFFFYLVIKLIQYVKAFYVNQQSKGIQISTKRDYSRHTNAYSLKTWLHMLCGKLNKSWNAWKKCRYYLHKTTNFWQ